jgi:hypothetical protein
LYVLARKFQAVFRRRVGLDCRDDLLLVVGADFGAMSTAGVAIGKRGVRRLPVAERSVPGRGDDDRRLTPLPARRLYAFAWQDDHGPESFYGLG